MLVTEAEEIILCISYKPGWTIKPVKSRFEGTVKLEIAYPAHDSDRELVIDGRLEEITVRDDTHIYVGDIPEYLEFEAKVRHVFKRILEIIIQEIETHEAREWMRYKPSIETNRGNTVRESFWSPFHPHKTEGMERYGTPELDRRFGVS